MREIEIIDVYKEGLILVRIGHKEGTKYGGMCIQMTIEEGKDLHKKLGDKLKEFCIIAES